MDGMNKLAKGKSRIIEITPHSGIWGMVASLVIPVRKLTNYTFFLKENKMLQITAFLFPW